MPLTGDPFIMPRTRDSSASNASPASPSTSERVGAPSPTSAPRTPSNASNITGEVRRASSERSHFRIAFEIWRENAWYFAGSLGSLAFAILLGVTLVGIVEGMKILVVVSSIFVGVMALGAIISSVVACRDSIESRRRSSSPIAAGSPLEATV